MPRFSRHTAGPEAARLLERALSVPRQVRQRASRSTAERATSNDLRARLEHLEAVVEGLQDAVHRESVRHDELIGALQRKTEPEEIARALSDDARRRGL